MILVNRCIRLWLVILIIVPFLVRCRAGASQESWDISEGYVPDSTTAIQIAQILFVRVYGEQVLKKKPFIATLKNGETWIVEGSLDEGMDGGVPHVEIQKSDGKIINLYHGK